MIGSEIRPIEITAGRHHAGGRREQGADEDHRLRETAADRPEHLADGVEQFLGHAAALEHQAHQREEGNRQQGVVLDDAEDARQRLEDAGRQQTDLDADEAEQQAAGGESANATGR